MIGFAVQLNSNRPSPEQSIERAKRATISSVYATWAGRWVLLLGEEVHVDASANFGVFYSSQDTGLVSSSVALLAQLTNAHFEAPQIFHEFGIDWYAGPATRTRSISRLMPSQVLHLSTLAVLPRPLTVGAVPRDLVASLAEALVTGLRNAGRYCNTLYLPLSGGLDSRTVLAASVAAGLKPIAYTFNKPNITKADLTLPPKLAAVAGIEHCLIARKAFSRERLELFEFHSAGHCAGIDNRYFAWGQWEGWAGDGLILRGGCFEFGRGYYYRDIPEDFDIEGRESARVLHRALGKRLGCDLQPQVREGLDRWLKWIAAHPENGLDFRDRTYLEQRLGCWLADVEQALDVTGTSRFHLANSQLIFSLFNHVPHAERKSFALQRRVIEFLAPPLARFPINPPDPTLRRIRNKLVKYQAQATIWLHATARFRANGNL